MDTNDHVVKYESGEIAKDTSITDLIKKSEIIEIPVVTSHTVAPEKDEIRPLVKLVMTANYPANVIFPENWAELEVEYSWNTSGTLFTCNALKYRVKSNGRRKGNVIFGFYSSATWQIRELSNDDAIQDGNWHTISGGGSVLGNAKEAHVHFQYIFDVGGADYWAAVDWTLDFVLPPPTITNPGVVWTALPTIRGTGATGATVKLYQSGAGTILFGTATVLGNQWVAQLTEPLWMADPFTMTALQTLNGVTSDWATPTPFAVLFKPVIVSTIVSADGKPTVSGTGGLKDATLEIWHQGGGGGVQLTTTVQSSGLWSATATAAWVPGPGTYSITAKQIGKVTKQSSDWADSKTFTVKPPKPAITAPPNPAAANQVLTITGVYSGAVNLLMLTEAGAVISGTFSTSGTTRTFTPTANWAAGTQKVKVVQTVNGVASDSSNLATLAVKPPKPTITAPPNPAAANQVLTITGVPSGTVILKMLTEAGAEIPGTFSTSGTSRTFTPTANWAVGTQKVKVVQTVGGLASDPSDLATLTVKPAKPAITAPPNPAASNQELTIIGVDSGTVTLKMLTEAGAEIRGIFSTSGTSRTFSPLEGWAPGTIKVKVVQTVDGLASDPSDLATLTVKTPAPAITAPPNPAPVNQVLTITRVYGTATLKMLTETGAEIAGTFSTSGTTRTFTPTANWAVGTQKVKVVQTVNGETSDPSDLVTLAVKPPKPTIINPLVVKTDKPTLSGTGVASATVKLYEHTVGTLVLGSDTVQADDTWTVTLTQPLRMADPFTIATCQTLNGMTSDWADLISFAVLFKPVISDVTVSADGKPTVSGTGGLEGATVDIRFQGGAGGTQLTATVQPDGSWRVTAPSAWVPNSYTITAKQIGPVTQQSSDWSDNKTFTVKPPKPAITALPAPVPSDQRLSITSVYSGTVTLKMLTEAGAEIAGTFATSGNTSLFTPTADWATGPHQVKVVQTVNEVASDPSDVCTFTVETGDKSEVPQFELPLPGARTSTRPLIRITGQSLALMTVRHAGAQTLHEEAANAEGVLAFVAATPLVPGPNALEAKQKGNGPESDWSEPHRFTVKELPQTPVIDAPTPGSFNPRNPIIRGKGETRGQILLRHEDDPDHLIGTLEGVTSWRWTAQEPWDVGQYTIQVQQTDDGDSSSWSEPRTFEVVDARYGIGDASPVLAQSALSKNESVLLRVQVVSGVTGEAVEGVKVEWRIAGEPAVLAMTVTDPDGWTRYLYTPGTAGKHTVLADLTSENQGIEITQPFEVTALPDDT